MSFIPHFFELGSVEVPSRVGPRGSIIDRRRISVVGDDPRHYPALIGLALNPDLIDYLIEQLPDDDGFTRELVELRSTMKDELWARFSDR